MEEVVTQTRLDESLADTDEAKPEELVANVPVKQLLDIFDAILAIKCGVDEILIVTDRILLRHRPS